MSIFEMLENLIVKKAYAQSLGSSLEEKISDVTTQNTTEGLINSIVKFAVPLSVTCVFVLLIYAGYLLMSSQGNPDKLQEGKEIITNALIGFALVLLSVAILYLISNTLGIDISGS